MSIKLIIPDTKEFEYGDDQVWKIVDDYFLCFEENYAKEEEEALLLNTNADQPRFDVISSKNLEPDHEEHKEGNTGGKVLKELLMADHNKPCPLYLFLDQLVKKAKAKKMDDLFFDDFIDPRPLHVFLEQLCKINEG